MSTAAYLVKIDKNFAKKTAKVQGDVFLTDHRVFIYRVFTVQVVSDKVNPANHMTSTGKTDTANNTKTKQSLSKTTHIHNIIKYETKTWFRNMPSGEEM